MPFHLETHELNVLTSSDDAFTIDEMQVTQETVIKALDQLTSMNDAAKQIKQEMTEHFQGHWMVIISPR